MLITEFDQELYEKTIREEGIEIGLKMALEKQMKEKIDRMNQLYLFLINEKRTDDLERAMRDEDFRNNLFKSYNL